MLTALRVSAGNIVQRVPLGDCIFGNAAAASSVARRKIEAPDSLQSVLITVKPCSSHLLILCA
ncbi:MAG: hypothetical protein HYX43_08805 [Burkholderiales bacterium]|nr:hypothetical protein [Burkholderiales bacterium]